VAAKGGQWKDGVYAPAKAAEVRPKLGTVTLALRDGKQEVPALARHGDLVVHQSLGGEGYSITHAPTGMSARHFGRRKVAEDFARHFGAGEGAETFKKAVAGDKAAGKEMGTLVRRWDSADRSAVDAKRKGMNVRPPKEKPKKTLSQLGEHRAKLPKEAHPYLRAEQRITGGRGAHDGQRYADVKWKGTVYRILQLTGDTPRVFKFGGNELRGSEIPDALRRRAGAIVSGAVARQDRWRHAADRMSSRERRAFERRTGKPVHLVGGIL
jgi:hypothetical protein